MEADCTGTLIALHDRPCISHTGDRHSVNVQLVNVQAFLLLALGVVGMCSLSWLVVS